MKHLLIALLLLTPSARAQDDAALRDRVGQLVERLNSAKAEDRDAAEKALVGLGPGTLGLLPTELAKPADDDAKARLARVREAIEKAQEGSAQEASKVTIRGRGLRLTEVLRELQKQSGNRITDLREVLGAETTNPALDLDIEDKPFFEALDIVAEEAQLATNFFTGDGSVGLMPGEPDLPDMIGVDTPESSPLIRYAGPFRVEFKRIGSSRELSTGEGRANAQFELAWEPRLRPMLLALKSEKLEIVDDRGETVPPDVAEESSTVVLRPENPVVEVNVTMQAPDREAKTLRSLKVRGDVTLPAGLRRFRFPDLMAQDATVRQGDIALTLLGSEVDANIWRIKVKLEMPGEGPAFESYQQGLFNNRLWLQRPDGSRFEHNGGFSQFAGGGGMLGFEYLFVDAPGKLSDYALIYETPSRVVTIPLEFEFNDVPLP